MANLTQGQSIKLGKVIERIIAPMLRQNGYAFTNSEEYENLLTRPDYIILEGARPIASLAVTATSTSQAWRMKRWRYIDEIAQLKSFYGEDFLAINVLYADMSLFQESERAITDAFFDVSILAVELEHGKELMDLATATVLAHSEDTVETISDRIVVSPVWKAHMPYLVSAIGRCLEDRGSLTGKNIFRPVWRREHPDYHATCRQCCVRSSRSGSPICAM